MTAEPHFIYNYIYIVCRQLASQGVKAGFKKKVSVAVTILTSGSLFQTLGPTAEKAWSPPLFYSNFHDDETQLISGTQQHSGGIDVYVVREVLKNTPI